MANETGAKLWVKSRPWSQDDDGDDEISLDIGQFLELSTLYLSV